MRILVKIEGIVIALFIMIMRWWLLNLGVLYVCECNVTEDMTNIIMLVFASVVAYIEIKTCVFKCINIVKGK